MATSISQLPSATTAEIADGAKIIINTTDNETKSTTLTTFRNTYLGDVQAVDLLIVTADVLTLNGTPIELIAAQGAATYVELLSATVRVKYNSAAYATNTTLQLTTSGASVSQYELDVLDATVDTGRKLTETTTATAGNTQLISNTAVNVTVSGGNPTAGDSDIHIYATFRVLA
jgi:hypothetical protein